jgi:hypothetical protein
MNIDSNFPTKLSGIDDVPEPFRDALEESVSPKESVRLLVYSPAFPAWEESSPELVPATPATKLLPATLLAVVDGRWLVATEEDDRVNIEQSTFADTLFLELTSILLSGELKIYFAAVGTHYAVTIPFNTVREEFYQEAIELISDGIDQKASTGDHYSDSILKVWPLKSRLQVERYRPKGQRLVNATRWGDMSDGFERSLCPGGALLVTERQLVSIQEQKISPCQRAADLQNLGGIITYFPRLRLLDFHISYHGQFGVLALLIHAAHGSEKWEIVFPSDREKAVLNTMQRALIK